MGLKTVPKEEEIPGAISHLSAYSIPQEGSFEEEEYLPAQDLEEIMNELIDKNETLFSHLVNLKLRCLWKAKGGQNRGRKTLGRIRTATGLVGFFSECDFIIVLSADHLREARANRKQIEASLLHELLHIQWDAEAGKVQIVGHDVEAFTEEIKIYGLWRTELERMAQTIQQLSLFGERKAVMNAQTAKNIRSTLNQFSGENDAIES